MEYRQRENNKLLTINSQLLMRLKSHCAKLGVTMKEYADAILEDAIKSDEEILDKEKK